MEFPFDMASRGAALLTLCCGLSIMASYVALDLIRRVRMARSVVGLRWLAGAAVSLGTGVWSIHVISLGERPLPFALGYHPVGAPLVWLLGVGVGLLGLGCASGRFASGWRLVFGAVVLGVGLASVQWLAMLALRLRPGIDWSIEPMLLALAVTVTGAVGAMLLSSRARAQPRRELHGWQTLASAVLGLSIVASQHLTIEAAGLGTQIYSLNEDQIASGTLILLASVGSMAMLLMALLLSVLESRLRDSLRHVEGKLQRQAFHDPVTQLPNRLLLESTLTEAVQQADSEEGQFALFFINLDGFKPVNELIGRHGGDRLLRAVAARLKANAKASDLVAHAGADEFLMLVRGNLSSPDLSRLAGRLLEAIHQPCRFGGRNASVSASIGVALYPDHGAIATLIAHSEAAMRAAKAAGGATYCFFESRMTSGAREQVELLGDLRNALANGELELYYQPKVHAPTAEITGVEALLRWHHPQRGPISPSVFIPIAERFGLIGNIGNWVIDEACRQTRAWADRGLFMRVAINLSVQQLRTPDLSERICAALRRHGVNPRLLTFEITESVAMEDSEGASLVFERLAAVGVRISIDDFGAGYSSLSYLRKLRVAELKIDRSFVVDLGTDSDARAVVDAVVKLGQALGLKVVAEGVETEDQHQILRQLGCDELQGYLFARPMPASELVVWAMEDVGPRALDFRDSLYQRTAPGALH